MAQIAIPILLLGSAYLISNENRNDNEEEKEKEGFSLINEEKNQGNLLANENKTFRPNISSSKNNMNNETQVSQYQDKYFLNPKKEIKGQTEYETLAGNKISVNDFNHNNMNVYYSSKSNGHTDIEHSSILDNYTGQGTFDIKKEEIATLFKPEENMQNVYGNKNNNDFFQSRMNDSGRHANTKPWEEIKDTPGIGMNYNDSNNEGFNNFTMQRDLYTPKNVDELRAANNPKLAYRLDDHMGPATNPIKNRGIQGKIVKQGPDSYFVNDNNLGMIASVAGQKNQGMNQDFIMPEANRSTTSVEYYGAKGNGNKQSNYVNGEYMDPHKQQLASNHVLNMANNGVNPTSSLNYGKESFNSLPNNRSTTNDSYFGSISGMVQNVVEPIVNGLRHTKKTNFVNGSNSGGNVTGNYKQPKTFNPNEVTSTTNREMYEKSLGMNHLNVQKQDATAYMNTRPMLMDTQRATMNQSETGPAMSGHTAFKSYNADLNPTRNKNKVVACDVRPNGNMSLFNNKVKMIDHNKEVCNNRQTPFYDPSIQNSLNNPAELLGEFTNLPQQYENKPQNNDYMIQAFKNNPYTHSLTNAV